MQRVNVYINMQERAWRLPRKEETKKEDLFNVFGRAFYYIAIHQHWMMHFATLCISSSAWKHYKNPAFVITVPSQQHLSSRSIYQHLQGGDHLKKWKAVECLPKKTIKSKMLMPEFTTSVSLSIHPERILSLNDTECIYHGSIFLHRYFDSAKYYRSVSLKQVRWENSILGTLSRFYDYNKLMSS